MIKLLVFDWDDVITIGGKEGYYECYRKTLKELGVHLDEKELNKRIQKNWGKPYREELRGILLEHPTLIDKACELYHRHKYGSTFLQRIRIIAGVKELLIKLAQKYKLAVATGNQSLIIQKMMTMFDIPHVFCQIVTVYDNNVPHRKGKPDPHILNLIMRKQNVSPQETLLIGDATNDVRMAHNAKVEPIVVLSGHLSKEDAINLGVKYIIKDVTYIENVLKNL